MSEWSKRQTRVVIYGGLVLLVLGWSHLKDIEVPDNRKAVIGIRAEF